MNNFRLGGGRRAREGGEMTYTYHTFPAAVAAVVADLPEAEPGNNLSAWRSGLTQPGSPTKVTDARGRSGVMSGRPTLVTAGSTPAALINLATQPARTRAAGPATESRGPLAGTQPNKRDPACSPSNCKPVHVLAEAELLPPHKGATCGQADKREIEQHGVLALALRSLGISRRACINFVENKPCFRSRFKLY